MLSKAQSVKPSLQEQQLELQRKIHLLEGERRASYTRSQAAIKKNQELILQLRQENQKLHRELAEVDEHNRPKGKAKSKLLQELVSLRRRVDALRHTTQTYQQRREELETEEERMNQECNSGAESFPAWVSEEEGDKMAFRALENRLDKFQFKCKEAEKCLSINLKLKTQMQDEFRTYEGQIDCLEAEFLKFSEELNNMQVLNKENQLSKKAAEAELQHLEEELSKEQKEREINLARLRQEAEHRKSQAEKTEKKVQRTVMQPDELGNEAQHDNSRIAAEEEKAISTLEEAFRSLSEAIGVTNIQDIVEHLILQKEKYQRLEKLKQENEEVLLQLKEEKELHSQQFEDIKYSGDAKLSSDQQVLEEREHQLKVQQQRRDAAGERLVGHVKTLNAIRAGIEHLAGKLQQISLTEESASKVPSDSDGFVLELLTQCELKLQILQKNLEGEDLASVKVNMEEDEFYTRIEGKLPQNNTKVKLPEGDTQELVKEEGETKQEEADIISRKALKHQSQLIVDSNSNKKPWKK